MDTEKTVIELHDGMKAVSRKDTVLLTYDNPTARELTEEELTALAAIYRIFCAMDPEEYKEAVLSRGDVHKLW